MKLGKLIREFRTQRNIWTIKEFIQKLGLDISPGYITKIEMHGEIPTPFFLHKLAPLMNIELNHLLDRAREEKIEVYKKAIAEKYK